MLSHSCHRFLLQAYGESYYFFFFTVMELGLSVKKLAWSLEYDKNIMHAAELGLKARFLAPRDCFSSPTAFSGERSLAP